MKFYGLSTGRDNKEKTNKPVFMIWSKKIVMNKMGRI